MLRFIFKTVDGGTETNTDKEYFFTVDADVPEIEAILLNDDKYHFSNLVGIEALKAKKEVCK